MSAGAVTLSLREALELSRILIADLASHCTRIEVAGSIRRAKPWINDIEIVCIPRTVPVPAVADLFGNEERPAATERDPGFADVVRRYAHTLVKGQPSTGKYMQLITRTGVKVDIVTATPENWGYIFAIRTGSAEYSKGLAHRWTKMGFTGQDGMLTKFGKPIPLPEERDLFHLLGIEWVPPTDR